MEVFGKLCAFCALWIITTMINGWVVMKLWLWFVVSAFSVPEINIGHGAGIALLVRLLVPFPSDDDEKETDWAKLWTGAIVRPLAGVVFGWIIYNMFV